MIGRRPLPERYLSWNERWGVPFGQPAAADVPLRERLTQPRKEYGPFAYQMYSGTRTFEYPWAYFAAGVEPGCRVLDVGGGTSGLQFVFALEGAVVLNVDPYAADSGGWPLGTWDAPHELHDQLNAVFDTRVRLVPKRLQDADVPAASVDRVVCLSVLEHLEPDDAREVVEHMARALVPGGLLVATVDLFFDLEPFGVMQRNGWGTNLDLHRLLDGQGLELVEGDPRELHGFPEFDRDRLVAQIPELFMAPRYPVVTQAIVARRA